MSPPRLRIRGELARRSLLSFGIRILFEPCIVPTIGNEIGLEERSDQQFVAHGLRKLPVSPVVVETGQVAFMHVDQLRHFIYPFAGKKGISNHRKSVPLPDV